MWSAPPTYWLSHSGQLTLLRHPLLMMLLSMARLHAYMTPHLWSCPPPCFMDSGCSAWQMLSTGTASPCDCESRQLNICSQRIFFHLHMQINTILGGRGRMRAGLQIMETVGSPCSHCLPTMCFLFAKKGLWVQWWKIAEKLFQVLQHCVLGNCFY